MRRTMLTGLASLSCLALVVSAVTAQAKMMIAPAPIAQRVATADAVVVGKVTGFGDKTVSAPQFPGAKNKVEYQIAIVKVQTDLAGAKGVKEIRVGFIPPMAPPPGGPVGPGGPVIRPGILRYPQVNLTLNQEACLFLTRHPSEDFYTLPAYFDVISKQGNPNFNKEVAEATRAAKLLADPKAGLEAENKDDRLLTAGMLISRYRTPKPSAGGRPKTEPIDAEQSKQILHVLADADWAARPAPGIGAFQMTPQNLFSRLGLDPKEWDQPKDARQIPAAAKKWLKEHADTYRIERFVAARDDKNDK
jgi:hypothetical protein